jgi:hypothetical protein
VLAQALFDLEATNQELKVDLRDLYITGAAEVDVGNSSRKAIIIHVRGFAPWNPLPWHTSRAAHPYVALVLHALCCEALHAPKCAEHPSVPARIVLVDEEAAPAVWCGSSGRCACR